MGDILKMSLFLFIFTSLFVFFFYFFLSVPWRKSCQTGFGKLKKKVEKSVLFGFYFQELKHVKNCIEN